MPKTDRPTEDEALGRCKNLTAEEIEENRKKAKEAHMLKGLFSSPGSRGRSSAEAQVLRQEPLEREEIKRVLHHDGCIAVVETEDGTVVCLTPKGLAQLLQEDP